MLDLAFRVVLMACWGLFVTIWLAGWLYNLWKGPKGPVAQRESTLTLIWVVGAALILLLSRAGLFKGLGWFGYTPLWMKALGVVCLVPSAALTFWARFALGTMWSDAPEVKVGHQLRTGGPYRVTRHPIYTGTVGMLLGSVLIGGLSYWILCALVGVGVTLLKLPSEEKMMEETFGEQYRQYRRHVPQIVPGLQRMRRNA